MLYSYELLNGSGLVCFLLPDSSFLIFLFILPDDFFHDRVFFPKLIDETSLFINLVA